MVYADPLQVVEVIGVIAGKGFTKICLVIEAVGPLAVVIVSVALYITGLLPLLTKVCVCVCGEVLELRVVPSPKFHE